MDLVGLGPTAFIRGKGDDGRPIDIRIDRNDFAAHGKGEESKFVYHALSRQEPVYSYSINGRLENAEFSGVSIRLESQTDAIKLTDASALGSVSQVSLIGLDPPADQFSCIVLNWPGPHKLIPSSSAQQAEWIAEGQVQRVVLRRVSVPTLEERTTPVDAHVFSSELTATDAFPVAHPFVCKLADEHRGKSHDPWLVATSLTRFVSRYVNADDTKNFSALGVAKFPRGDCKSYAMLLVALLRTQRIPARYVTGLAAPSNSPTRDLHAHAWVEVWIGRWIPVDPTFSEMPAGLLHIRLDDNGEPHLDMFPFGKTVTIIQTEQLETPSEK
jgi:hypothetical protein